MTYDPQNHKPLREVVYEELKRRILVGDITPRMRMMEIQLSEDLGVSRTPVREAIRKLEKEGLVTIEPRRGAYASEISVEDMVNVLVVRQDLEGLACEIAAEKITDEALQGLRKNTEEYAEAIKNEDMLGMIRCDENFHKLIFDASGNKTLIKFGGMAQDAALRFRYLYYDGFRRYENMPEEHKGIIEALSDHDPVKARQLASDHISGLKEFVIEEGRRAFRRHHMF